jgi:hypothetical protein
MKNLVLVSSIKDVPEKFRNRIYIVGVNSWEESVLFLSGKKADTVVFWGSGVPAERLLKSVESYEGNLLVYSEEDPGPVMRSRFTRVLRGRQPVKWAELGRLSKAGELLRQVKVSMGVLP